MGVSASVSNKAALLRENTGEQNEGSFAKAQLQPWQLTLALALTLFP